VLKNGRIINCFNNNSLIITEQLILLPKIQANSKAHAFLLSILLALKWMSFQPLLDGREKNLAIMKGG